MCLFVSSGIPKIHSNSGPKKDPKWPQKWSLDPSGRVQKRPQNQFGTQTETKPNTNHKKGVHTPPQPFGPLFEPTLKHNGKVPLRGDFFARNFPNRVLEWFLSYVKWRQEGFPPKRELDFHLFTKSRKIVQKGFMLDPCSEKNRTVNQQKRFLSGLEKSSKKCQQKEVLESRSN